jgi:FkbM family methyltransferase
MLARLITQAPISYRFKKSLLKRLAPNVIRGHDFSRDFYGLCYRGNTANAIDFQVFVNGAYEKYGLALMRDQLAQRGPAHTAIAVDVGANVGHHTLFLATLCAQVHAFEPYPPVLARLRRQVADNHLDHVTIHDFGMGEVDAALPFYPPDQDNLGVGSFIEGHHQSNLPVNSLQIKQGDQVVLGLDLPRLDLIKIDVEGFEPEVLAGLKNTLARYQPAVLFEMGATTLSRSVGRDWGAVFPSGYQFQTFDRFNRETGAYRLQPYVWGATTPSEMVLATPSFPLAKGAVIA